MYTFESFDSNTTYIFGYIYIHIVYEMNSYIYISIEHRLTEPDLGINNVG
jgi:hypothetical protein